MHRFRNRRRAGEALRRNSAAAYAAPKASDAHDIPDSRRRVCRTKARRHQMRRGYRRTRDSWRLVPSLIAQALTFPQQQHCGDHRPAEQEILDGDVEREPYSAGVAIVVDDDRRTELVSQPSTGIWKPRTITIEIQYTARRNSPVRNTANS